MPALRRRGPHAPGGSPELEGPRIALALIVAISLGVLAAALVKLAGDSGSGLEHHRRRARAHAGSRRRPRAPATSTTAGDAPTASTPAAAASFT